MAQVRDEDVVQFVVSRFTHAERSYSGLAQKMGEWYHSFRGWKKAKIEEHRNELIVPVALALLEVDVSRKVGLTASGWPICQFVGYDPVNPKPAKNIETIVSAQAEDCGFYEKLYDFYLAADIMGTGVLRTGWKHEHQMMKYRYINPITEAEEVEEVKPFLTEGY